MDLSRTMYGVLIRMYPKELRQAFGREMLETFDEASEEFGPGWLLWEASISVLRQNIMRAGKQSVVVAPVSRAGLMSGVYPYVDPFELRATRLMLALILTLLLTASFQVQDPGPIHVARHSIRRR